MTFSSHSIFIIILFYNCRWYWLTFSQRMSSVKGYLLSHFQIVVSLTCSQLGVSDFCLFFKVEWIIVINFNNCIYYLVTWMSAWLLSEKKIIAWLKQTICFCVNSFLEKNIEIIACVFERLTFFWEAVLYVNVIQLFV